MYVYEHSMYVYEHSILIQIICTYPILCVLDCPCDIILVDIESNHMWS